MTYVDIGRVRFESGDPCRPRYEDIYQPSADEPWIQLEPALQVWEDLYEIQVRVELAEGDVEITGEDRRPLCRELNDPQARPEVRYEDPEARNACILTWRRGDPAGDATRVFRIYCHRRHHDLTDEEKVHGGIFVAVTTSISRLRPLIPIKVPGVIDLRDIVVIGTDAKGRPLYDTFKPLEATGAKLPDGVELAPAYRVRKSQGLDFSMTMGIEDAVWDGKVQYIQPKDRKPPALHGTYHSENPKKYHFFWKTDDQELGYQGEIVTFHLGATLEKNVQELQFPGWLQRAGFKNWNEYRLALKSINADPTVIQPPPCDPVYRVCSD